MTEFLQSTLAEHNETVTRNLSGKLVQEEIKTSQYGAYSMPIIITTT